MIYVFGAWLAFNRVRFKASMKKVIKSVRDFTRKEWFLLVAVAAITIIIILFEFL
jgi:hypothetical protein